MTLFCTCCARSETDKFVRHAHRERCPAHPEAPVLEAAERCRNADPSRVYGFDVTYTTHDGRELSCHYKTTSEAHARRSAMLRSCAREVTSIRALTEKEYVRAFGAARRM